MPPLNSENIKPTGQMMLLSIFEPPEETSSGLLLSESGGYATPVLATILRVGEGVSKYRPGQVVMFRRFAVDEINLQDGDGRKDFYLLPEEEVIAVVEELTK